eukprot:16442379-Heterocapsa_arctica.AAC.1
MIKNETTVAWLAWMVRDLPPDSNLWLFSPYRFRKCLKEALQFFNLLNLGLTSASLRAGGAIHMLETGIPVPNIRFASCWASERALASYLQEAEAASTLLQVSEAQARRLPVFIKSSKFTKEAPCLAFLSV